ncbi:uncharacterized protein [Ptychodera flava]|uniref:uncharacterized protein isoform X2 n=1 Tax=Ptychodera flava TaxID=63121 RepID=UPI00396A0CF0
MDINRRWGLYIENVSTMSWKTDNYKFLLGKLLVSSESSMEISPTLMDLYDTLANSGNHSTNINDNGQDSSLGNRNNHSASENVQIDLQPINKDKHESSNQISDERLSTNQNMERECRPISGISTSSMSSMDSQSSKSYNRDVSSTEEDNRKTEELSVEKGNSSDSVSTASKEQNEQENSDLAIDNIEQSQPVLEEMVPEMTPTDNVSDYDNIEQSEMPDVLDTKLEIIEEQMITQSEESFNSATSESTDKVADNNDDDTTSAEQANDMTVSHGDYVKHSSQGEDESVQSTQTKSTDTSKLRKSSRINPPMSVVDPTARINGAASPPVSPPQKAKHPHKTSKQDNVTYIGRVVKEIVETERSYVKAMDDIIEGYLHVILDKPELPISPEEYSTLFGNIEEIYDFNKGLLDELESCDLDPIQIAECFVDKDDGFKRYTQYCTNYPNSVAVLTELSEIGAVMKFFKSRQSALKHPLPLGSYLLKPVQRILKYRLLFQEIHRHFDKKADGFDVIEEALATMTRIARYINEMKRKHEAAVHVQEIQSQLHGWDGSLVSYGDLVLEDVFRMVGARADRFLFLFEKALLIGKKREDGLISIKAVIMCDNMILQEVVQRDTLWFVIIPFDNNKTQYVIQAKSMEHKKYWTHHLKRLIIENHPLAVPIHAKQVILDQDKDKYYASDDSAELLEKKDNGRNKEERRNKRHARRKSDPSLRKLRRGSVQLKAISGMKKPEIINPKGSMKKSRHTSGHSSTEMDTQDTQSESESPHKKKSSASPQPQTQKASQKPSKERKRSKEEAVQKSGSLTRSDCVKSKSLDSLSTNQADPKNSVKQLGGDDSSPRARRLSQELDDRNPRKSIEVSNEIVQAVEAVFDKMKKGENVSDVTDKVQQKPDIEKTTSANNSVERTLSGQGTEAKTDSDMHGSVERMNSGSDDERKAKLSQRRKSLPRNDLILEESAPLAMEEEFENGINKGEKPISEVLNNIAEEESGKHVDAYTVPRRKPSGTHININYRSSTSVLEQATLRNAVFKIKGTDKIKQYASQNRTYAQENEDIWVKRTDTATTTASQASLVQSQSLSTVYTHYSQTYVEKSLPKLSMAHLTSPKSFPDSPSPTSPKSGPVSPLSYTSQLSPSNETLIDADLPLPSPPEGKETLIGAEEESGSRLAPGEKSILHKSSDDVDGTTTTCDRTDKTRSLSTSSDRSQSDHGETLHSGQKLADSSSISDVSQPQPEIEEKPSLPPEAEEILDESEKYVVANSKPSKKSVPAFPADNSGHTDAKTEAASSNESVTDNIKSMLHSLGSRLTSHKTPSPGPSPRSSQSVEHSSSSDEAKSTQPTKQTPPDSPDKEQKSHRVYQLARAYSQRLKSKATRSFNIKRRSASESNVNAEESYEHRLANLLGGENAQGGANIGARYAKQGDTLNRNLKFSFSETKPIIFEDDEIESIEKESPIFTRAASTHTVMLRQKPKRTEDDDDSDFATRRRSVRESIMNFEEIMKAMSLPTVPNYSSHSRIQGLQVEEDDPEPQFKSVKERRRELEERVSKPVPRQRILSEFLDMSDGSSVSSAESEWTSRYSSAPTSPLHTAGSCSTLNKASEESVEGISRRTSSSEEGELMPIIMKSIKERFRELQQSISKPVPKRDAKEEIKMQRQVAEGACSDDDSQETQVDSGQSTLTSGSVLSTGQTDTAKEGSGKQNSAASLVMHDDDERDQLGGESESESGHTSESEYETPIGSLDNIPDVLNTMDTLEDLPADVTDDDSIEDEATLEAENFEETFSKKSLDLEPTVTPTQSERTLDIGMNNEQTESQA